MERIIPTSNVVVKKKRKKPCPKHVLTLEQRVAVISDHDNLTTNARILANKYSCGRTQIQNIVKRRQAILAVYHATAGQNVYNTDGGYDSSTDGIGGEGRIAPSSSQFVESLTAILGEWIQRSGARGIAIDDSSLQTASNDIAALLSPGNQQQHDYNNGYSTDSKWLLSILQDFMAIRPPQAKRKMSLNYADIMNELGINPGIEGSTTAEWYAGASATEWQQSNEEFRKSVGCNLLNDEVEVEEKPVMLEAMVQHGGGFDAEAHCLAKAVRSYRDALNALGPIEQFALLQGNVRAVGLINQLENVFREKLGKTLRN